MVAEERKKFGGHFWPRILVRIVLGVGQMNISLRHHVISIDQSNSIL